MLDHFTSLGRARKSLLNERKRIPPCNRISRHGVSENHPALDSWCWQWWEAYYQMTKNLFWATGLRTTWETCKETKKIRVSYVNHRWEPTSKKKSESEYHKLAPWKKTLPQKMATMFLFELAEHLWLYSGDHVRSSGTREGKKTKVAQVASSARSMQSSTIFSYFGLECVRLWTMGNFSLELYLHIYMYIFLGNDGSKKMENDEFCFSNNIWWCFADLECWCS